MATLHLPSHKYLEAFEAVARTGSIVAAARELNLTAAAISQRIVALETRLGYRIFDRTGNSVTPTAAGAAAVAPVVRMLAAYQQTAALLANFGTSSSVTIEAPVSICSKWLAPRLPTLIGALPELRIELRGVTTRVRMEQHEADIAIHYALDPSDDLPRDMVVERLMSEPVFPVCAPSLAARASENLAALPLIHDMIADRYRLFPDWPRWFATFGGTMPASDGGIRVSPSSLVLDAAVSRSGVALARGALVQDHLEQGQLVRPVADSYPLRFDYFISYSVHRRHDPLFMAGVAALISLGRVTEAAFS